MYETISVISVIAVIVSLIILIISFIMDKPKKIGVIALSVSFSVLTICVLRSLSMCLVILGFVFGIAFLAALIVSAVKHCDKKVIITEILVLILTAVLFVYGGMLFGKEYNEEKNGNSVNISAEYELSDSNM